MHQTTLFKPALALRFQNIGLRMKGPRINYVALIRNDTDNDSKVNKL